jgi:hypothetical protein
VESVESAVETATDKSAKSTAEPTKSVVESATVEPTTTVKTSAATVEPTATVETSAATVGTAAPFVGVGRMWLAECSNAQQSHGGDCHCSAYPRSGSMLA